MFSQRSKVISRRKFRLTDESKTLLIERLNHIDLAFATQVLNFTEIELKQMERIPTVLGGLSMFVSQAALLYALGYEAKLREVGSLPPTEDVATVREVFERLASQPRLEDATGPLIVNGSGKQIYVSRLMGMTMETVCQGTETSILVAEAVLNRVHFENRGYVGSQSGNAPVHDTSCPNCQTTVSKLDAV